MITHRRVLRPFLTAALAAALVLGGGGLSPVSADTPLNWDQAPDVSALEYLMVLVLIPVGLALVITLLALVPSLARNRGYEPGQAWRGESKWFGGPQKGVAAADEVDRAELEAGRGETGGGSGRW